MRLEARSLCTALDRAIELGHQEHANQLASSAATLATTNASLCERLTRLRLAQGDHETALAILASCRESTASLRLLRCACLVQSGRRSQAHSDLLRWSRKSTAPIDARLMLALLEWDAGDLHGAALSLVRNLRHLEDPRSLELLVLVAARKGRFEQAQRWAERLRACAAATFAERAVRTFCLSLQLPERAEPAKPSAEHVGTLKLEIMSAEAVIPALTQALEIDDDRDGAALLLAAIEQAMPDLSNRAAAEHAAMRLQRTIVRTEASDPAASSTDVIARIGEAGISPMEKAA